MPNDFHNRTVSGLALAAGLALALNGAYLAAFATPSFFYVANSLLHPVLGAVAVFAGCLCIWRNGQAFQTGLGRLMLAFFALAAAAGGYLAIAGMTRPHSMALYAHVAASLFGLFLLLLFFRQRLRLGAASSVWRGAWHWSVGVLGVAAVLYVSAMAFQRLDPDPADSIRNPTTAPLSMTKEGAGAGSLMFPSSARTLDGKPIPASFFLTSQACQRCHPDIYAQWNSSAHHHSSFNNQWYRKAVEYMQDTVGIKPSLWCGGCHDHALIAAGMMQRYPIRQLEQTPAGQAGLGCVSCHAIVHVNSTMGQGDFTFSYPALAGLAESRNPVIRWLHDYQVRLDPKAHRSAFLKPFQTRPQEVARFCSACHKVHLDVPVNHYRYLKGFDEYDNWQASGVSGQGARSFYYPPKPMMCVDCHMPLVASRDMGNIRGFVHSHRFAAANTAIPTAFGDTTQLQDVKSFLKSALRVDIFALAQEPASEAEAARVAGNAGGVPQVSSTFAVGEESSAGLTGPAMVAGAPVRLIAPLGRVPVVVHPGETVRVEVVVRTLNVGHFFPGGTVDAYDCWVELKAVDSKGRVIFWSGEAADGGKGPVDAGAHFYRSLQLDAHGNVINKRNSWSTRAVMYARLIPPGAADTVHYRLQIPRDAGSTITLTARVNYRKFAWWNTQWAFAGRRDRSVAYPAATPNYDDTQWIFARHVEGVAAREQEIPDVPVVVMARDKIDLTVSPPPRPAAAGRAPQFVENLALDPADWQRWNDYGIGLLLQGDLKGAERVFRIVTRLRPGYADGWVNVARALVQEGNVDDAKAPLATALRLDPTLASAHFFTGLALKVQGNYPAALRQFAMAAGRYPNDRVVRNQMGRMLFLQRKYQQAVDEYQKTLAIDPEDLEAHYNLMLCYRGLRRDDLAAREEKLYMRFKADESSVAITGSYKLKHAEDNNEAQPIHEHASAPLVAAPRYPIYSSAGHGERSLSARAARKHASNASLNVSGELAGPTAASPGGRVPK
jgi:tetratricopeptide (TPR) repeat protein